jgi:probable phosphoglycerate mutase
MTLTRLLIARHGNTFGPGDVVTRVGRTDLPLVESGFEQGRVLGHYLKQDRFVPDVIFTSCLQRTMQTAAQAQEAMGTALVPQALPAFDEVDYGPDENQPETAVIARLGKAALAAWEADGIVPEGWKADSAAIAANWQDFAAGILREHAGKTVLVVTSNGIARFSPHLTGDFAAFRAQHAIKISTGGLCIFESVGLGPLWVCTAWNVKPKDHLKDHLAG